MKGIIDEYADAKAAARNRVLADERLKLVCEIARLREALVEISATFNKPLCLQGNAPAMIAYATLKHES